MKIDWQKEKKKPLSSFHKKFIWMQLLLIGKKKITLHFNLKGKDATSVKWLLSILTLFVP